MRPLRIGGNMPILVTVLEVLGIIALVVWLVKVFR